jgi:glycosyltransferase involved in cell wall biosynthesis
MKVSVVMVTYNQEAYIGQAIEGVLMQQTDFPVELVIGEDCSTDGTRAIIEQFQTKYPDRIRAAFRDTNLGGAENFRQAYDDATGEYIALCEGDDYWTDPLKLQKQVTFLDAHPEYSFSFHNVNVLDQATGTTRHHLAPGTMQSRYTVANLFSGNFIQSCSVVYRRCNLPALPEWLQKLPIGDWPIHMLHAEHGPIHYQDEIMGVYRILSSGAWANRSAAYRIERSITTALLFNAALDGKYSGRLGATVVNWYNTLMDIHQHQGELRTAFNYMFKALEEVTEPALHSPFLTRYLSLFIDMIATLITEGKNEEAFSLYTSHADRLPFVAELRKMDAIMLQLRERLAGTAVS